MSRVHIVVLGKPEPAGSKRAFVRGTRAVVVDANAASRPWKQEVAGEALRAIRAQKPLEGPLSLVATFYLARPSGHYGKRGLRGSAPAYPTVRPDTTKLLRAIEDALTGIVWHDDAQVVSQFVAKEYGHPPRVEIAIEELRPTNDPYSAP